MPVAPYGTWPSPFTADAIIADSVRLVDVELDAHSLWWVEGRPAQGGRQVLVRRTHDGQVADMTPPPFSVRTRVHEYGGRAFCVAGDRLWFANDADARLYAMTLDGDDGGAPQPLTPEGPWRYAEPQFDARRDRLICVRETARDGLEPSNELVAVTADGTVTVLASGHDFYSAPRVSEDGSQLAYLTWDHPAMPWDGTTLWRCAMNDAGDGVAATAVAGGPKEAIFQPEWGPDGALYYISDNSGWWNLYRASEPHTSLLPKAADFGRPYWQFGMYTYGFTDTGQIICSWCENGAWSLGVLDSHNNTLRPLAVPYTAFDNIRVHGQRLACLAGAPTLPGAVVEIDSASGACQVHRVGASLSVDEADLSVPSALLYNSDGAQVHAFFYPPANAHYRGPPHERPPLIVIGHGGPTGATAAVLEPRIQFWTSRGFAVVDVNYRGSTGFGRAYRDALKGGWGVVDVADCVNAAQHLAQAGDVDGERLIIRGGSAGGYTALAALTFHDVFKAAASYYGIGELEALANDTHKFEARYLDSLIGPYPQDKALYVERSPINHIQSLACPVIFFQGLEDKVVPPNQAQMMVAALREKGLPVAYLAFEGEQHGFRRASTIKRTLEAELYFYGKVFGFEPADAIAEVAIHNI